MLSRLTVALLSAWLAGAVGTASAEPISFGTSQAGGLTYNIALALAKEAKELDGLDIRATPYRSPSQVVPLVNSDELQLGATSGMELTAAMGGEGAFAGNAMENLRAIGSMFPVQLTFAVKSDNPAKSVANLKGLRVPSGYRASSTGGLLMSSILQAAGLTYDDVVPVEVASFGEARDVFQEGRADAVHIIIGAGSYVRLANQVGGLHALSIGDSPDVDAVLKAIHPALRSELVQADGGAVGVEEDIRVVAYDYVLYANKDLSDDVAAKMAEILVDRASAMAESVKGFHLFDVNQVAADVGVPLHPGARNYYVERGLLPKSQ